MLVKTILAISVWVLSGASGALYLKYTTTTKPIYRSDIAAFFLIGTLFGPAPWIAIAVDSIVSDSCVIRCEEE